MKLHNQVQVEWDADTGEVHTVTVIEDGAEVVKINGHVAARIAETIDGFCIHAAPTRKLLHPDFADDSKDWVHKIDACPVKMIGASKCH